ncbi:MAG: BACON domain-containing protein [Blastocatellia bacterium]
MALTFCLLALMAQAASAAPPSRWTPRGPGGGGALFAPSFSPHNANEVYLSCDMSELFHSTNLGGSWDLLDFRQIQGNRQSQVRFTSNPSVLYALDYTSIGGADSVTPSKSTDGGNTWRRLTSDPTFGGAYALFVDGNGTNNLILSDYSHVFFSSDGGASFSLKYTAAGANGCFVAGAFFDGASIYAGTSAGLLVSTNGGGTFALASASGIPSGEAIVSFAGAKQGATTRFFCVTLNSADVYPGLFTESSYFSYRGVYSLDWGQPAWVRKTTGITASDFPFFVSMSGGDISTAYVAGQNSVEFPVVYKTANGGGNWQSVFLTNNNQNVFTGWSGRGGDRDWSYGAGALGFAASPTDPNRVAFTDLGFAHVTTDGGATWKQMYLNAADQNPMNALTPKGRYYRGVGLEDTSCWWLTWADAGNVFASYSDIRGTRSTDGGNSWSFNYSGQPYNSTYQCVKHPASGALYVAVSSLHDLYQSTYLTDARIDGGTGAIKFSTDKGATWATLHDFLHPVIGLALDPNNPNRMYASVIHSTAGGIYVSNDIQNGPASTWTKVLANPPRTEGHPFNVCVLNDGTLVCTYSGRRNASGAFTASSGVFASTDGGNTWADRSDAGMRYWTKDIVIDPYDASQGTWYAAVFSGWGGPPNGLGGLYKTTNRGASWVRVNNLDRVTSCAISPINANEMYLTTETDGLWYSSNINSSAPSFSAVTSYPFRQPERVFYNPYNPNEIWVTSFGNGVRVGNACAFTLSSPGMFLPQTGGGGGVTLTAPGGCAWAAASNHSWIIITSEDNGAGDGTITFEARENFTGGARQGTMTIAGQTFTVIQDGGLADCTYLISPTSKAFSQVGGAGVINLVSEPRCGWAAVADVNWITITSGRMGIGDATVNYSVAPNTTGLSRKGRVTVGGQVFTVKQK